MKKKIMGIIGKKIIDVGFCHDYYVAFLEDGTKIQFMDVDLSGMKPECQCSGDHKNCPAAKRGRG